MHKRLRKILPWVVAAALLGYLLYTIPMDALADALRRANIWCLVGMVFFVDFGCLLTDSWGTARVATMFLAPVRFTEMLPVRAATYLMAILNYNLGQAGLVYYFHRVKGVPVLAATSIVLMMMGTVVLLLGVMSLGGIAVATDDRTRSFGMVVASIVVGAAVYFVILRIRPRFLARYALLAPLFDAGVSGHLKATAVRVPHMIVLIVAHMMGLRCFGIDLPVGAGLIFVPLVLLVASIPLTPFGLGTMQVTAVHFFAPYANAATEEAARAMVFAYSLSLATLALTLQGLLGLACIGRVSKLGIFDQKPPEDGDSGAGGG